MNSFALNRIIVHRLGDFAVYFRRTRVVPALSVGVRLEDNRIVLACVDHISDAEIRKLLEGALIGLDAGNVIAGIRPADVKPEESPHE